MAITRPLPSERGKSWQVSVAVVFIAGSLIAGACISFYRQTRAEMMTALMQKQQEAARVNELQIEVAMTQEDIQRATSDPRVIESMARDLGFVKNGEIVIRSKAQRPGSKATPGSDSLGVR